jgi:hypothetical protein
MAHNERHSAVGVHTAINERSHSPNGKEDEENLDDDVQIQVRYVYRYVTGELEEESSFKALIVTAILVVSFIVLASGLQRNPEVFAVQESVWNDIVEDANFAFVGPMGNKDFKDVHSVADFLSWLRKGAVPLIISNDPVYSEDYALCPNNECIASAMEPAYVTSEGKEFKIPSFGHYLRYNRIMGGVRLAQELAKEQPCRGVQGREWLTKPCFSTYGSQGIDFALPPDEANLPADARERVEWLMLTTSNDELAAQLTDMEDGCRSVTHELKNRSSCLCLSCPTTKAGRGPWVDESTLLVEIKLILFNPTYGVLTRMQVIFFFSHGGRIWKRIDLQSVRTEFAELPDPMTVVAMIVWVLLTIHLIISETREIKETVKAYGLKEAPRKYMKFWNAVDWISIVISVVIVGLYYILANAASTCLDAAWDTMTPQKGPVLETAFDRLDDAFRAAMAFRMALFVYSLVVILRCFKAFSSQARLAVVSQTLVACTTDVFHFGCVFIFIFTMFNVAGVVIFGHRVASFATLERANITGFFILMGEFDFAEMEMAAGRFLARFWLMMFFIVLVLLMFNMLLAIVFETYSEVRSGLGSHAETVWGQVYDFIERDLRERKGASLTLEFIESALRKKFGDPKKPRGLQTEEVEAEETEINMEELIAMCSGMKMNQARHIFHHANQEQKRDEEEKGMRSRSLTSRKCGNIAVSLLQLILDY